MWRRVCTRAPATADIFYSFEVERKKKGTRSRGEIKTRSRGLVSRPRLRLVHAWADARRTRSFEAMRSIDRGDRLIVSVPAIFERFVIASNDRSTSSRSFRSIRSSVRRTRCTCTSIQRASSMGRTTVLLNCVPCRKSRRHVDGSCQRMLLSYVRGFPFNYD